MLKFIQVRVLKPAQEAGHHRPAPLPHGQKGHSDTQLVCALVSFRRFIIAKNIIRVLFVCSGNICRSPMAEAVFRHLVTQAGLANRFEIASAGLDDWHIGERPHHGTQSVLARNQISLDTQKRAQRLTQTDLNHHDYILAMDQENQLGLSRYGQRVPRLLEFSPNKGPLNVPDPYYLNNFDEVYRLIWDGCQGLLATIRQEESL